MISVEQLKIALNKLKVLANMSIDEILLKELENTNDWALLSQYHELTEDFLDMFKDKLKWGTIFNRIKDKVQKERIINRYFDKFIQNAADASTLLKLYTINEDNLLKYSDYLGLYDIFTKQRLSINCIEMFLQKYPNDYDMTLDLCTKYQRLNIEFIEKHKDKLNWNKVRRYQHISSEFKRKHFKYILRDLFRKRFS